MGGLIAQTGLVNYGARCRVTGQIPSNFLGGLPSIRTVNYFSRAHQSPWRILHLLRTRLPEALLEKEPWLPLCTHLHFSCFQCSTRASLAAGPDGLESRVSSLAQPVQGGNLSLSSGPGRTVTQTVGGWRELGFCLLCKVLNKPLFSHAPHWPSKASLLLHTFHS